MLPREHSLRARARPVHEGNSRGKAKSDRIGANKIAALLRGGLFPVAYVCPPKMRSTRDLLRRELAVIAKDHDPDAYFRIRTVPGIGKIPSLVILYEIRDISLDRCLVLTATS